MSKEHFNKKSQWLTSSEEPSYGKADRPIVLSQKRPRILINSILFILTIGTTLLAGALQQGVNPLQEPARIVEGLPFSLALLFILLSHEMGHYLASKKHHIDATLPYFIPAPTFIGTFGAVIKMRSPIHNKKALFDIGVAGPLAGIAVTLPILIIGLKLSVVKTVEVPIEGELILGTSLMDLTSQAFFVPFPARLLCFHLAPGHLQVSLQVSYFHPSGASAFGTDPVRNIPPGCLPVH